MPCQNPCTNNPIFQALEADNAHLWKRIRTVETENEQLKAQIQDTDDLLDDISQFRADKISLKAIIAEAVEILTDPQITDGDIGAAVRLLKKARGI